ncbi:hypothetical protein BGX34_001477 [Mortierella sp. NVP85]|nr:hypothetical protein BGX34_001477 [Mortierella sp. NVP85]
MTDTRSRGAATETTPLLSSSSSTSPSPSSSPSTTPTTEDPITIYARVLAENLPWYKRPSAFWLFPIYGLAAVSGGMLISTVGQFRAALLCREYQLRHAPSDSTNLSTDIASFIFQAAATASSATLYGGSGMEYGGSDNLYAFGGIVRPGPECQTPEIQAYTAKVMALIDVLGNIAAVLTIGYYASLSDKHGRVKVMAIGLINTFLTMGYLFVMGNWWDQVGIPFMTFAALAGGLLGGINVGQMMCLVYAADCTDPKRRRLVFSWLHAGLFWGLAIGPVIGGIIVNKTDNFLNLVYIDAGATVVALLLLVFFLPESLPHKQPAHIRKLYQEALEAAGQQSQPSAASSSASAPVAVGPESNKSNPEQRASWHWHMSRSLLLFKPNGRNTNLILLAAITFLQMLALKGTFSVIILYTNRAFNWTELEDGILFSLSSSVRLLTLLFLIPVLAHFYHKWARKQQDPQTKHGKDVDATTTTTPTDTPAHPPTTDGRDSEIEHAGKGLLVGIEDSYVASSVEQLGEETLNLSEDEDERRAGGKSERTRPSASSSSRLAGSSKPSGSALPSSSSSSSPNATGSKATTPTATEDKPVVDLRFDIWMVRAGYVITTFTYIGYGLAVEGWQFYLSSALHAFGIIYAPSSKSLLTGLVDSSQFGAVLGAVQMVESISGILSPVLISWVYALTVKSRPEFVWYCCSALTGACAVLAFMVHPKQTAVKGSA